MKCVHTLVPTFGACYPTKKSVPTKSHKNYSKIYKENEWFTSIDEDKTELDWDDYDLTNELFYPLLHTGELGGSNDWLYDNLFDQNEDGNDSIYEDADFTYEHMLYPQELEGEKRIEGEENDTDCETEHNNVNYNETMQENELTFNSLNFDEDGGVNHVPCSTDVATTPDQNGPLDENIDYSLPSDGTLDYCNYLDDLNTHGYYDDVGYCDVYEGCDNFSDGSQ